MSKTFSDYRDLINRLNKFKPASDIKAKACCPGHDDSHPSMTLAIGDDGRLLANCKAGCTFQRICEGLGVTPAAFFPPGEWKPGHRGDPTRRGRIAQLFSYERAGPDGEVEVVCQTAVLILDSSGASVVRTRMENPRFDASQPEGDQNQLWNWSSTPPACLYRSPELDVRRRVFLVDSEEDANALHEYGYLGTTVPQGFKSMNVTHAGLLRGYNVTVIGNCDAYGGEGDATKHSDAAKAVARMLLGKAASVQLMLIGRAPKGASFGIMMSNCGLEPDEAKKAFEEQIKASPTIRSLAMLDAIRPPLNDQAEQIEPYIARCVPHLNAERIARLSEQLRLPADSFKEFDQLGYDPAQHCFVLPERGSSGQVVGASRRWSNGSKANVNASKRGLTIPRAFNVETAFDPRPILIVEGFSDAAACSCAGLRVLGRPSNMGGGDLLLSLLSRCPSGTKVLVFGENDEREKDGRKEWPGRDGANKVAADLQPLRERGIDVEVMMPPGGFKDAREFLTARTESWDGRGRAFLQRSGYSGGPVAAAEVKKPILERIGETVSLLRKNRTPYNPGEAAEEYDRLTLAIADKAEMPEDKIEELLATVCARLIRSWDARREAKRA